MTEAQSKVVAIQIEKRRRGPEQQLEYHVGASSEMRHSKQREASWGVDVIKFFKY